MEVLQIIIMVTGIIKNTLSSQGLALEYLIAILHNINVFRRIDHFIVM